MTCLRMRRGFLGHWERWVCEFFLFFAYGCYQYFSIQLWRVLEFWYWSFLLFDDIINEFNALWRVARVRVFWYGCSVFFCFVCVCVCVYFNLCDQCFLFFGGERLKSEKNRFSLSELGRNLNLWLHLRKHK